MQLVPTVFSGKKKDGDFSYMIAQEEHCRTQFIINENVLDALSDDDTPGCGTAAIRNHTWRHADTPHCGIPTGWCVSSRGFDKMGYHEKKAVMCAINRIIGLAVKYNVDKIVYSANPQKLSEIGTGTFNLPQDAIDFISVQLNLLPQKIAALQDEVKNGTVTLDEYFGKIDATESNELALIAELYDEVGTLRRKQNGFMAKKRRLEDGDDDFAQLLNPDLFPEAFAGFASSSM